jgi:hypothetical protein
LRGIVYLPVRVRYPVVRPNQIAAEMVWEMASSMSDLRARADPPSPGDALKWRRSSVMLIAPSPVFRAEKLCAGSPRRETALPGSRIRSLA